MHDVCACCDTCCDDEHANHCLIHLTCIIPPICPIALPSDKLKEKQDKAAAKDKETIERWEEFWLDREHNGRFSNFVLKKIAKKEEIILRGSHANKVIEALVTEEFLKKEALKKRLVQT
jgi:hypothetical protein